MCITIILAYLVSYDTHMHEVRYSNDMCYKILNCISIILYIYFVNMPIGNILFFIKNT